MQTKVCTQCHEEKPVEQFNWQLKSKGKRKGDCRACSMDRQRVPDAAHLQSELRESWPVLKMYDVLRQPRMGVSS
jgi:hypothetical protein